MFVTVLFIFTDHPIVGQAASNCCIQAKRNFIEDLILATCNLITRGELESG